MGKKNTILAVWTYHFPVIEPQIEGWLEHFYWETLSGFWPRQIQYLEKHYQTLPFPFEEIQSPGFEMEATWTLDQLIGFINSWSAVRKSIESQGESMLSEQFRELERIWGKKTKQREIRWPLYFRIGKVA